MSDFIQLDPRIKSIKCSKDGTKLFIERYTEHGITTEIKPMVSDIFSSLQMDEVKQDSRIKKATAISYRLVSKP